MSVESNLAKQILISWKLEIVLSVPIVGKQTHLQHYFNKIMSDEELNEG